MSAAGPMESMVERCPRFGKWIGGCRFEARYDVHPRMARFKSEGGHSGEEVAAMARAMTETIYVRDVCVRCGKTVERPALTDQRAGG